MKRAVARLLSAFAARSCTANGSVRRRRGDARRSAEELETRIVLSTTGSISGVSFEDFDRDGNRDGGEPGIEGALVYLDLNENGQFTSGEPSVLSGADGTWTIENVAPGDYVVREVRPDGFQSTTRGNDAGFFYGVMFQSGVTEDTDLVRIDGATGEVTRIGQLAVRLQGLVQTNSGELYGINAFTNQLYSINPTTAAVTLVGNTGVLPVYSLTYDPVEDEIYGLSKPTNMDAETYLVRFDRDTGAATSVGGPVIGLGNRSNLSGMTYDPVSDRFIAFDNSDDAFYAFSRDGSAVLVADPSSFDTRGLATNSRYIVFQELLVPSGTWRLKGLDLNTGNVQIIAALDDSEVLDALEWVGDRSLYRVMIAAGDTADGINFGHWNPAAPGRITGVSFEDLDRDGMQDPGETGIEGALVFLDLNDNGALDADEPTVRTASDGSYAFENVAPGNYTVREILPLGFTSTTRGNDPGYYLGVMFVSGTTGASDLVRIDSTTGQVTRIGDLSKRIHGLVRTNAGELYGVSGFDNALYSIDPDTAQVTLIGPAGVLPVFALGYDPVHDEIYGLAKPADIHPETYLVRFDRTTGAATTIGGPIAGMERRGPVGGMTYDPVSDRFIVYDNEDAQFYAVSRDGTGELLADLSGMASRVLATNSRDFVFQSLNVNGNRDLTGIDLSTGQTSRVLTLSEGQFLESLDWVGDRSLYRVQVDPYQTESQVNFGNERFNSPPQVSAGGPYAIFEGEGVLLSATGSDPDEDTLSYAWDLDDDGEFDDAFGREVAVTAETLLAAGIADDGNHPIGVQVSDGIFTVTAGTTISVANVAPEITQVTSDASVVGAAAEGTPVVLSGAFTDPGVLDVHTLVIDWGDGSSLTKLVPQEDGAGTFEESHVYAFGGAYDVQITLIDDDGGTDEQSVTVFVTGARLQDGVLQIVGTSAGDVVSINQQAGGGLMVHAGFLDDEGDQRTFGLAEPIDAIVVWLGDGDDTLTLAGNIDIPLIGLGQAGNDQLKGALARDLLIGGVGSDVLNGHKDEDLLIGGSTAFDDDLESLLAILGEWSSSQRSFSERMQNLTDGSGSEERLNGDVFLILDSTFFDDDEPDDLVGGADVDWLLAGSGDAGS